MVIFCLLLAMWCQERPEVAAFTESLVKLRSEFRTVQIEFTLNRTDAVFKNSKELSCRLLMLREKNGTQHGVLRLSNDSDPNCSEMWVLRGDDLYSFDYMGKVVTKHTAAKEGLLAYATSAWPGVRLFDREETQKQCVVRFTNQDANYKYFTVKAEDQPFDVLGRPRKPPTIEYRFAVAKRDHSICQIYINHPNGDTEHLKVTKWAIDAAEDITAKDFPDPTKFPDGWRMEEWSGWEAFRKQTWKKLEEELKARQGK